MHKKRLSAIISLGAIDAQVARLLLIHSRGWYSSRNLRVGSWEKRARRGRVFRMKNTFVRKFVYNFNVVVV